MSNQLKIKAMAKKNATPEKIDSLKKSVDLKEIVEKIGSLIASRSELEFAIQDQLRKIDSYNEEIRNLKKLIK